jgi:hypothetical protein
MTQVAVLRDASQAFATSLFAAMQAVAPSVGVQVIAVDLRDAAESERSVESFARSANGGLIPVSSAAAVRHRDLIIDLAARYKLRRCTGSLLRHCCRPDVLWARSLGPVPASGRLCSSYPQGGHQSQDRQSARPRSATNASRPHWPGLLSGVQIAQGYAPYPVLPLDDLARASFHAHMVVPFTLEETRAPDRASKPN